MVRWLGSLLLLITEDAVITQEKVPDYKTRLKEKYHARPQKCRIYNTNVLYSKHLDPNPGVFTYQCDKYK